MNPQQVKQAIIDSVCKAYDFPVDVVVDKDRAAELMECRRVIMHMIRNKTNYSLRLIDESFGFTFGSTSQYAVNHVEKKLLSDQAFKRMYENIIDSVNKQTQK
jgi:chromosomal replication initiation ATPase DnaA